MLFLPDSWFIPVEVKPEVSECVWHNEKHRELLEEAAVHLKDFFLNENLIGEGLDRLGLITQREDKPFIHKDAPHRQQQYFLKTERFFNPYSIDTGSGRNVIFRQLQYKGVGRNNLATRQDWLHSWGGMTLPECLLELLIERHLDSLYPNLSVPILAAFIYKNYDQGFLIRSADFIRCEQIVPQIKKAEKDNTILWLEKRLPGHRSDWHKNICQSFIQLLRSGFVHRSPLAQNISIDGRLLDHYSLDIFITHGPPPFSVEVDFSAPIPSFSDRESLKDFIHKTEIKDFQSVFNQLFRQCEMVANAFDCLGLKRLEFTEIHDLIKHEFPSSFAFYFTKESLKDDLINSLSETELEVEALNQTRILISGTKSIRTKMHQDLSRMINLNRKFNLPFQKKEFLHVLKSASLGNLGKDLS